jgi:hypothetical protein
MLILRSTLCRWMTLATIFLLVACGGGGSSVGGSSNGGPSTGTRAVLPTVSSDSVPSGTLLTLDPAYFSTQPGDTFEFVDINAQGFQVGAMARSVDAHPLSTSGFILRDNQNGEKSNTVYLRSEKGWTQDFRIYEDLPKETRDILGTIVEYPAMVSASGQLQRSIRQGVWGVDLDNDQVNESFRLVFEQSFQGIDTETYFGKTVTLAHFQSTLTFSIIPSRADGATQTTVTTEDAYFAKNFGQVRLTTREWTAGQEAQAFSSTLNLKDASSSGKNWVDYIRTNGNKIAVNLTFRQMVYDKYRDVYYASIPAEYLTDIISPPSIPRGANSIATINAQTGSVTFSAPVGVNPGALAISSDGARLWVGVDSTKEIVELSLASGTITSRLSVLGAPTQIQASPKEPGTFAAVLGQVILVRNMVQQRDIVTTPPVLNNNVLDFSPRVDAIAFDDVGSTLFGLEFNVSPSLLSQFNVTANGLTRRNAAIYKAASAIPSSIQLDVVANQLVWSASGAEIISIDTLATTAIANSSVCRKRNATGIVCFRFQTNANGFITGLELVPVTLPSLSESPAISMGSASTFIEQPWITPGTNGQVAFGWREGGNYSGAPFNRLVLFENPQLR